MYPVSKRQTPSASGIGPIGQPSNLMTISLSPTQPDEWEVDRDQIQMNNKLGMGQYGDVYEALWMRSAGGDGGGDKSTHQPMTVAVKTLKVEKCQNICNSFNKSQIKKMDI
jgi:hypothetical protein